MTLQSEAQKDTIFWFAAPEIASSEGDNPIYLRFLSYNSPTIVTVSQPANPSFTPITVNIPANSNESIDLSPFLNDIESPNANIISNNGLKIHSTAIITAYYELLATTNREIFTLKGGKGLGTDFYTPFQETWNSIQTTPKSSSSIDIVASEDNTTVLITPKTDIIGHSGGASFSITLNEGETYSARDTNSLATTSLSGSIIASNKPISITVFSGALNNSGCTSSIGDQITSTEYIGKNYIIRKGNSSIEKIYILSTQNATTINIQNSSTTNTLINWSETYEYNLTDSITYISTSKPVYIWHASGNECNLSATQIPDLHCTGTSSNSFSRATSDSLFLILNVKTGFEGMFQLNGNSSTINASSFTTVTGTGGEYMSAKIHVNTSDVPVNSFNKIVNTGDIFSFAILTGGNSNGSAYSYFSDYNSTPHINAGNNATVCANNTVALTGDIGGGDNTGFWSTNGFGSFSQTNDNLINNYIVSPIDTAISPINIILTSTGKCATIKDTIQLTITPSPSVNASADQTVCGNNSAIQLNGLISGATTTGTWSSTGMGTFAPNNTTLNAIYTPSNSNAIELILTPTNIGSCNLVTDTMTVNITPSPIVEAGPDTIYVCENNAIINMLGSVTGGTSTGKWTTSGNGLFWPDNLTLAASYQASSSDVIFGYTTLYLESTNNGNCIAEKDSIIIIYTPNPVVDAGLNILFCSNGNNIQLDGTIAGPTTTGSWTGGNGIYNVNNNDLTGTYTPTAAEINTGTFILTLTSSSNLNCNAVSDFVQINVVSPPLANFNYTNECLGKEIEFTDFSLSGFGNLTSWNWTFDDLSSSNQQNNQHLYTAANSYNVQLIVGTDVGCLDTLIQTVQVYELPIADFSYEPTCNSNQIILDFVDQSTSTDPLNYWYYNFAGLGTSNLANPTHLFSTFGIFNITHIVGTINGCLDTIVEPIIIPERPIAGFYYNTSDGLDIGATYNFIDTSSHATTFNWEFGEGNNSSEQNPTNIYYSNGTYIVTQYATSALGCTDSTSLIIDIKTITSKISELIPNGISPNGDGKNDVWNLDFLNLYYPNATVDVYNKWGQQLFHSNGYTTPWDATNNGSIVPEGTYYYVIDLKDGSETPIYKGHILVLKSRNR